MGVLLWQALYGVGHLSYSHRKKKTRRRDRHRRRLRIVSIQHGHRCSGGGRARGALLAVLSVWKTSSLAARVRPQCSNHPQTYWYSTPSFGHVPPEEGRRKKHKSALMVSLARLTVDDVVVEHCRL